jgi:hypothetical protein
MDEICRFEIFQMYVNRDATAAILQVKQFERNIGQLSQILTSMKRKRKKEPRTKKIIG